MRIVNIKDVKQIFLEKTDLDDETIQTVVDEIPTVDWIDVNRGLPITGLRVLCQWERRNGIDKEIYITIMHKNDNNQWLSDLGLCNGKVTHWMELPEVIH